MAPIGFSTGCMYKSSLTLDNIISFYSHIGADALEISFANIKELNDFKHDNDLLETIMGFSYVSLHAPFKGIRYGDNDFSRHTLKKLQELCKELPVKGIVIHPDNVDDFNMMEDSGLPFLMENMDKRKTKGILPEEFEEYSKQYSFGFVLDLKHVFEHDTTMALAQDYVNAMRGKLMEYHISGHDDGTSNHVLLHNSSSRMSIINSIFYNNDKPIIIESVFEEPNKFTAKKELEFVKSELARLRAN